MNKDKILEELNGMTPAEITSKVKRSELIEWWTILYGCKPPKSKTSSQLAYDMCHMADSINRAHVLARGLNLG